ncbi:MAG: sulfatase [Planctomycetaceae bacterium]|nr:sulfatase [Planctomycetaceae bacterium]
MKSPVLLIFCAVMTSMCHVHAEDTPPNIVMIISDDQSWTDYSFMGHSDIRTPHLDRLAARSATFRRGYVPVALCRPSLATMITGLYPHQHGITGNDPSPNPNLSADQQNELRERLISKIDACPTAPQLLGPKGYVSFQSGKWWEGNYRRGGFTEGMTRGFPQRGGRHGDDGLDIGRKGMQPVLNFIDSAVDRKKPFFLWYAPFLPHTPHTPPQRLLSKYETAGRDPALAKYYAMCEWFDETCGELINHLEQKNVFENTLIVYVTDNGWIQRTGDMKLPDGWKQGFAPKSKQSPYDGGTRTPIMVCWPKKIPPADRPELVSSIDLMPTMLAAAGVEIPENLPGLNLLPACCNQEKLTRNELYGESFAHDVADVDQPEASLLYRWVIEDHWKLLLTYDGKTNRYAAAHLNLGPGPQLFDLKADPMEDHNVAADHKDIVARLAGKLDNWWKVTSRKTVTTVE